MDLEGKSQTTVFFLVFVYFYLRVEKQLALHSWTLKTFLVVVEAEWIEGEPNAEWILSLQHTHLAWADFKIKIE